MTSKLNIKIMNKLARFYVWSIVLYGSETIENWNTKKIGTYLESFEIWCWKRMKIKWSEKVTNKQVLERIGEKRTLLNWPYSEKKLPSS